MPEKLTMIFEGSPETVEDMAGELMRIARVVSDYKDVRMTITFEELKTISRKPEHPPSFEEYPVDNRNTNYQLMPGNGNILHIAPGTSYPLCGVLTSFLASADAESLCLSQANKPILPPGKRLCGNCTNTAEWKAVLHELERGQ